MRLKLSKKKPIRMMRKTRQMMTKMGIRKRKRKKLKKSLIQFAKLMVSLKRKKGLTELNLS